MHYSQIEAAGDAPAEEIRDLDYYAGAKRVTVGGVPQRVFQWRSRELSAQIAAIETARDAGCEVELADLPQFSFVPAEREEPRELAKRRAPAVTLKPSPMMRDYYKSGARVSAGKVPCRLARPLGKNHSIRHWDPLCEPMGGFGKWVERAAEWWAAGEEDRAARAEREAEAELIDATPTDEIGELPAADPSQVEPDPIEEIEAPAISAPEPAQDASAPIAAAIPAPEPVIALSVAEIGPERQSEPESDPVAAILARLAALEAAIATLPAETDAAPTVAMRERSPAHERAVRRAWAERRERRAAQRGGAAFRHMAEAAEDALSAERVALAAMADKRRRAVIKARRHWKMRLVARGQYQAAERGEREQWNKRQRGLDRARRMVASVRKGEALQRQRADVLAAQFAKLSADMADPSQPERASDITRLMRERDEARTALAAVTARCERAETARDQLGDAVESMGTRLAIAEAAVRRLAA